MSAKGFLFKALLTRVVNRTTVVCVSPFQDAHQLGAILTGAKTSLQLIKGDAPISILVKSLENIFELNYIVGVRLDCNRHQGNLLDLLRFLELLNVS